MELLYSELIVFGLNTNSIAVSKSLNANDIEECQVSTTTTGKQRGNKSGGALIFDTQVYTYKS